MPTGLEMIRARAGPLALIAALMGGLLWQTGGGSQQPNSRAAGDPPDKKKKMAISETLQGMGGTGGSTARRQGDLDYDPKDTRIFSNSPSAHSKKNPQKVRDLPGEEDGAGGTGRQGLDGKHIGNRENDLPWKKHTGRDFREGEDADKHI
ncbi:hypothetical protein QBC46DRAFT_294520 [Diplogelasinospora grovesii]|uniref:Uncharacterized protein n=1 Tax=Diplogelasinospora grovesii TaxID=303347 RepID=A0AAN6S1T9_9PEZI|nr:hypothetical protein QBC46DRAFT_294520 [Diplogelasinospora grovesii]